MTASAIGICATNALACCSPVASITFSICGFSVFSVRFTMPRSSSLVGNSTMTLNRKRSSCASGNGYVPSFSIGFCVAKTRNGSSNLWLSFPTVTVCSCMASNSADCVFGVARLISSASTRFAKSGPFSKRKLLPFSSLTIILVPVTSLGIRSGVNWIRLKDNWNTSPIVRTSMVFPSPGIPSNNTFPPASNASITCRIISFCPIMPLPISSSQAFTFC